MASRSKGLDEITPTGPVLHRDLAPFYSGIDTTVRHRTKKTKGCLGRKTALAMTFRLMMSAKKKWRKLDGAFRLPEIIEGVEFKDGIKQEKHAA